MKSGFHLFAHHEKKCSFNFVKLYCSDMKLIFKIETRPCVMGRLLFKALYISRHGHLDIIVKHALNRKWEVCAVKKYISINPWERINCVLPL